ncbi:MAG: GNAT family N-acetyltransferase [Aristaeellaceae bacterium]
MRIETERLLIRDLAPMDEERLRAIVRQRDVVRFMGDWAENCDRLQSYIAWHQTQKDSTDVRKNKRYAIALKAQPDTLIGMVGMGMEDTLREVEMAYFLDEACQGHGYATEAVLALFDWCMAVSDLPYMILTIDCANAASCRVAERAGFELFERRYPIGHRQPNMESDSYYYYRKYRSS